MHVQIFKVSFLGPSVSFSGEASDALFEHEDSKRLDTVDEAVDPEIELEVVDQIWFVHVPLGDLLVPRFEVDIFEPSCEVNAFSLAHVDRFYDEGLGFLFVELGLEIIGIGWQHPCLWEKVEVVFVVFS